MTRIAPQAAHRIANQHTVGPVCRRDETDDRIVADRVELDASISVVGILTALKLLNLFFTVFVFRHLLNDEVWIRGQAEPLRDYLDRIRIAFLRVERNPVHVARRVKLANNFARQLDLLCLLRPVVGFLFDDDRRGSNSDQRGIRDSLWAADPVLPTVNRRAGRFDKRIEGE